MTVPFAIQRGERPSHHNYADINDEVWTILRSCWEADPMERPSMHALSLLFNILAAVRSTKPCHDSAVIKDSNGNCRQPLCRVDTHPNVFSTKPNEILRILSPHSQILPRLLRPMRHRALSCSEASIKSSTSKAFPYPCRWKGCHARFGVLKECQVHQLRHVHTDIALDCRPWQGPITLRTNILTCSS